MKTQKDINRKLVLSDKQIDVAVQRIIKKKKKYGTDIITTIINGEIITAVKYRKLIDLERPSPSSRRKITKRYILKAFGGRGIKTTDGKTITVKSTGGADKMNFQSKHKISLYIDDLIRIGVLQSDGPDYQNNHIHWFYYDSYIAFENKVYYGCINIKETNNEYNFYDINKIKEVETSTPLNMERGSNLNNNITNDNSDVKK